MNWFRGADEFTLREWRRLRRPLRSDAWFPAFFYLLCVAAMAAMFRWGGAGRGFSEVALQRALIALLGGAPSWVVFAILALLLALTAAALWPGYERHRLKLVIARAYSDMRSMAVAIESYAVDNAYYPACSRPAPAPYAFANSLGHAQELPRPAPNLNQNCRPGSVASRILTFRARENLWAPFLLTTPIAYLLDYPRDAFSDAPRAHFGYYTPMPGYGWVLFSPGPGGWRRILELEPPPGVQYAFDIPAQWAADLWEIYNNAPPTNFSAAPYTYDPTNGWYSTGFIGRVSR